MEGRASRFSVLAVAATVLTLVTNSPLIAQDARRPWFDVAVGVAPATQDLTGGHMTGAGVASRVAVGIQTKSGHGLRLHGLTSLFPSNTDHIHDPTLGHQPLGNVLLGSLGASVLIGAPLDQATLGGLYLLGGGGYHVTGNDAIPDRSGWGWHVGIGRTVAFRSRLLVFEVSLYRVPGIRRGRESLWLIPITAGLRF